MTKLIVGLGNPGSEYENTRHNLGFLVLDAFAEKLRISFARSKFQGLFAENFDAEKIILVKPQTFMNRSGDCVAPWVQFLKISQKDILVVHDELDFALGKMKGQWAAGPAGHRGISSIIERMGSKEFGRLRLGVGHPGRSSQVVSHVLSDFSREDELLVAEVISRGVEALAIFVKKGLDEMIQFVNTSAAVLVSKN